VPKASACGWLVLVIGERDVDIKDTTGRALAAPFSQTFTVGTTQSGPSNGSGFLSGQVFDATNGRRLAGVNLAIAPSAISIVTDVNGQYASAVDEGVYTIHASASGYTDVWRQVVVPAGSGIVPIDIRLTARGTSLQHGGDDSITRKARLTTAAGTLPPGTTLTITSVGSQSLAGLLPLGWSPLAAAEVRAMWPSAPATAPAQLSFDLPAAATTPGRSFTAVEYDTTRDEWRVLQAVVALSGNSASFTINVPPSLTSFRARLPRRARRPRRTARPHRRRRAGRRARSMCHADLPDARGPVVPAQSADRAAEWPHRRHAQQPVSVGHRRAGVRQRRAPARRRLDGRRAAVLDRPDPLPLAGRHDVGGRLPSRTQRARRTSRCRSASITSRSSRIPDDSTAGRWSARPADRSPPATACRSTSPPAPRHPRFTPRPRRSRTSRSSTSPLHDGRRLYARAQRCRTGNPAVQLLKPANATFTIDAVNASAQLIVAEVAAGTPYGRIFRMVAATSAPQSVGATSKVRVATAAIDPAKLPLDGIVRPGQYLLLLASSTSTRSRPTARSI
jgi:hypothetical protein